MCRNRNPEGLPLCDGDSIQKFLKLILSRNVSRKVDSMTVAQFLEDFDV